MRKIIILFVVSCVMVIGGLCIFTMEASNIEEVMHVETSQFKKEETKFSNETKTIIINEDLYSTKSQGTIVHGLTIGDFVKDPDLDPYTMVVEYNDKYEMRITQNIDNTQVTFYSSYTWKDLNDSTRYFDESLEVWKDKKIEYKDYDANFFRVNVRYGSKLNVVSSSDYYSNPASSEVTY